MVVSYAQFFSFEEIRRFIHFSDPCDVIPDRCDLTMIPYTRLVLLLIIYRRNLSLWTP